MKEVHSTPKAMCPMCSTPCSWLHRAGGEPREVLFSEMDHRLEEKKSIPSPQTPLE